MSIRGSTTMASDMSIGKDIIIDGAGAGAGA
jgi:hypothetical protein